MKYLNKYNNLDILNEDWDWSSKIISSSSYDRDDDIKEIFLELTDLGGAISIEHYLVDADFKLNQQRISYVNDPIYKTYMVTLILDNPGNFNHKMDKTIDIFNEIYDILSKLKGFGFMFRISVNFNTTSTHNRLQISIYHVDDVIPWEKIFT